MLDALLIGQLNKLCLNIFLRVDVTKKGRWPIGNNPHYYKIHRVSNHVGRYYFWLVVRGNVLSFLLRINIFLTVRYMLAC